MRRFPYQRILLFVGLAALYAAGLGVRRAVLMAQYKALGRPPPFTLESALYYRRVEQVLREGRLPKLDADLGYPEGVVVSETDTVGAEYGYAALARCFPGALPLSERLRWIESAWFCLGIVWMALWIRWRTGSWAGAGWGGAFYAFGLSSVIRSTGQELLHENFALPLLIAHLAFEARALNAATARRRVGSAVISASFLAAALASWDLTQFYILLWMMAAAFALLPWHRSAASGDRVSWLIHMAALVLVGTVNPYLRTHAFLLSPAMLWGYGLVLAILVRARLKPSVGGAVLLVAVLVAPLAVGLVRTTGYQESYSHFMDLLAAKIRFLNRKPADPSLLSFESRMMWVPALDSASWALTMRLFPVMLPLTILGGTVCWLRRKSRKDPGLIRLVFFFSGSLLTFCFFTRFHVFLAVFSAGLLGGWASRTWEVGKWKRWLTAGLLLGGLGAEAAHTLDRPERWGRSNVYYDELEELVRWLGQNVRPQPVLANFGVSASIAAYGGCPVILHPKFETRAIRQRVREYGEKLFRGTEREFRDWADNRGARYYVHGVGELASVEPALQMRYVVDALNPPDYAAVRLFEKQPDSTRWFRLVWSNRKYRVFRLLTRAEEAAADQYSESAREAFEQGNLTLAEERAVSALLLDPHHEPAQEILKHVGSLRAQGFRATARETP